MWIEIPEGLKIENEMGAVTFYLDARYHTTQIFEAHSPIISPDQHADAPVDYCF